MIHRSPTARPAANRLPRTVVIIGLVSLLNDFASEMVTPLIPLLLATVLGAGPMALGFIEGLADATPYRFNLWAGRRSDMARRRRKPFVLFGYALSNLVRPLIGFSGSWLMVLGIRVTDPVGKGLRTAPAGGRDPRTGAPHTQPGATRTVALAGLECKNPHLSRGAWPVRPRTHSRNLPRVGGPGKRP